MGFLFVRLEAFLISTVQPKTKTSLSEPGAVLLRADISLFPAGSVSALRVFAESWASQRLPLPWVSAWLGDTQGEEMPSVPAVRAAEPSAVSHGSLLLCFRDLYGRLRFTSLVNVGPRTLRKDCFPREVLKNLWGAWGKPH